MLPLLTIHLAIIADAISEAIQSAFTESVLPSLKIIIPIIGIITFIGSGGALLFSYVPPAKPVMRHNGLYGMGTAAIVTPLVWVLATKLFNVG